MLTQITQHREGWWTLVITTSNGSVLAYEDGLPSKDACLTYSHAIVAEDNISQHVRDWAGWS